MDRHAGFRLRPGQAPIVRAPLRLACVARPRRRRFPSIMRLQELAGFDSLLIWSTRKVNG
jgi:hypothetical protein